MTSCDRRCSTDQASRTPYLEHINARYIRIVNVERVPAVENLERPYPTGDQRRHDKLVFFPSGDQENPFGIGTIYVETWIATTSDCAMEPETIVPPFGDALPLTSVDPPHTKRTFASVTSESRTSRPVIGSAVLL